MSKFNHTIGLTVVAVVLAVVCFAIIAGPMRFDHEKENRETVVKQRLLKIRTAEEAYRKKHGTYANWQQLHAAGLLADSLRYIPFNEQKTFRLTVSTYISKSEERIPMMECSAMYDDFLSGLDKNSIAALVQEAQMAGRFPGLKIGDIITPNDNAGNWE